MDKKFAICILVCFLQLTYSLSQDSANCIRINQLGYYPESKKTVVVVNNQATEFTIETAAGKPVFKGKLSEPKFWDKSGEMIKTGDFSSITTPGNYVIHLNNNASATTFEISNGIYKNAAIAAVKTFYLQRASMPIESQFAGKFSRSEGHPDTTCYFHPSSGHANGKIASAKGWYDAGDYNKYVVNAGLTVGLLMQLYEINSDWLLDGTLNIPESGNKISDLLDEILYELDWLVTMQDSDGGVFFKITNLTFDPMYMPDKTFEKRYVVGKSTTSSLCFAAMLAQASRIYAPVNSAFSKTMLLKAEKAWDWALKNPNIEYKNPADVKTGEYGDNEFTDDFFWAGCELFATTKKNDYLLAIKKHKKPFSFSIGDNWRFYIPNLGYYTILNSQKQFQTEVKNMALQGIVTIADSLIERINSIPYRIPVDSFVWGSNSDMLDVAIIFAYAYKYAGSKKYLDGMIDCTDYIFGKNPMNLSYVTGFGSHSAMNPHHRLSVADGITEPLPGFLVGGPNMFRQDDNGQSWGVTYKNHKPACCYNDIAGSWASNEIAINWNAPLAFVTAFIDITMNKRKNLK